jgi:hypothetical protein
VKLPQRLRDRERRALQTGEWGEWENGPLPPPSPNLGWLARVHTTKKNRVFAVLIRTVRTPWGDVDHAAIRNCSSTNVPWAAKQRIKDELFGKDRVAVEVFPPADELVDSANMYHLWVMPTSYRLPFGL